jgi:PAS domain S-box-containing protein
MALAEHSPDIIARADRARRYLYVNARIEAATGLERGRFIGKTNAELDLPPGLSDPWERAIEATLRTGREQRFDFTVASPGGELLYEARMVPEFDPAGEVQTVLCVARDVTAPHLPATAPGA